MSIIVKGTRALLNLALRVHRASVLAAVSKHQVDAENAKLDQVNQQKYVQHMKARELELADIAADKQKLARTVEALANAELRRLPERVA